MQVIVAKTAGFCYGVERAVRMAEETAREGGCKMLGSIIHNADVVRRLHDLGAQEIERVCEVSAGERVLIRAHGASRETFCALRERGAEIVDATCPHVLRVQKIAAETVREGRRLIIIGEHDHPEVLGVASYAENALIFADETELQTWLHKDENNCNSALSVVAQTTLIRGIWKKCIEIIKKECTNCKTYDTMCSATDGRQTEAARIAGEVDAMVVVGDRKSANTRHLKEICEGICPRVLFVERADELSLSAFDGCRVAGLTAGASTPAGIIKEVVNKMTDEIKVADVNEESFVEMLDRNFKTIRSGETVKGTVTEINSTEVVVDLGCKQPGYIKLEELSSDPNVKPEDVVKVGDVIDLFVIRVSDVDGFAQLSHKKLEAGKVWDELETAVNEKTVMEGLITEVNKGGLVVQVKGVRVFVPASQSGQPRGADLSEMVKQKVSLRITEVNRARRRVVGSIRSVTHEAYVAAREAIWDAMEVGKHYTGKVKSMTNYGVFVDIGGIDGMVHITELTWARIKTPAEVVSIGDELDVYVLAFDREKGRISLGVKDRAAEPWKLFLEKYSVGDVVNVRIVKLMAFGAFAEIIPGVDGLIHISQLADRRVDKVASVVHEDDRVDVKIIAIDEEKKNVSLSIRALIAPEEFEESAPATEEEEAPVEAAPAEEAAPVEEN